MKIDNTVLMLYKGSKRALQLTILKQSDNTLYEPNAAYASVYDADGVIATAEVECAVESNVISFILDTSILVKGYYVIRWRILKTVGINTYTSYHKTVLRIAKL